MEKISTRVGKISPGVGKKYEPELEKIMVHVKRQSWKTSGQSWKIRPQSWKIRPQSWKNTLPPNWKNRFTSRGRLIFLVHYSTAPAVRDHSHFLPRPFPYKELCLCLFPIVKRLGARHGWFGLKDATWGPWVPKYASWPGVWLRLVWA